jgi:hypothetical protein
VDLGVSLSLLLGTKQVSSLRDTCSLGGEHARTSSSGSLNELMNSDTVGKTVRGSTIGSPARWSFTGWYDCIDYLQSKLNHYSLWFDFLLITHSAVLISWLKNIVGWFVVREKYCFGWKNKLKSTDYKPDGSSLPPNRIVGWRRCSINELSTL